MSRIEKHLSHLVMICMLNVSVFGQSPGSPKLKSYSLGGKFSLGTNVEKEAVGLVYVYPESDSTVLFFIDVNRGAPSYNMGNLYGRLKVKSGVGVFTKNIEGPERLCKLEFIFQSNSLKISTIADNDDCGFGYGVLADGVYKRKSKSIPEYFISMTEEKHFFKKTDPDTWQND